MLRPTVDLQTMSSTTARDTCAERTTHQHHGHKHLTKETSSWKTTQNLLFVFPSHSLQLLGTASRLLSSLSSHSAAHSQLHSSLSLNPQHTPQHLSLSLSPSSALHTVPGSTDYLVTRADSSASPWAEGTGNDQRNERAQIQSVRLDSNSPTASQGNRTNSSTSCTGDPSQYPVQRRFTSENANECCRPRRPARQCPRTM